MPYIFSFLITLCSFKKKKLKTTGYAQFYYLLFIVLDLLTQLEKTPIFEYPPAVLIPADIQQF